MLSPLKKNKIDFIKSEKNLTENKIIRMQGAWGSEEGEEGEGLLKAFLSTLILEQHHFWQTQNPGSERSFSGLS